MTSTGMTVRAVGLVESGILVNGWTVTDLLSGFTVRGEADISGVSGETPGRGPLWRRTTVTLTRLEAVRELVAEALDERAADPELTSANPRTPRVRFPWGVGESTTDVLVTGPDAATVAAYLRTVGLRARCVDRDAALRLAADLEMARAELEDLEVEGGAPRTFSGAEDGAELSDDPGDDFGDDLGDDSGDDPGEDSGLDRPVRRLSDRPGNRRAVAAGACVLVLVGALATAGVLQRGGDSPAPVAATPSSASPPVPSATGTPPDEVSPPPTTEVPRWRDPVRRGDTTSVGATDRADIPVTADLEGWRLTGASPQHEIWMSDDPDARILVAATPTPLGTQEELDARLLTGLWETPGIRVTSQAPVDYEEAHPGSVTRWQVRLIDGHQVSVGCQYRDSTVDQTTRRIAACDRFTATARVG